MIEINLVPDVKQELIKAKRVRTFVISIAVLVGLAAIGVVILLAVYLFGVQNIRSALADNDIKNKSAQLADIDDLANTLTIQHQLTVLTQLHDTKNINSRFFDLLAAINPPAPNQITFSLAKIDSENGTIRFEGQAVNGYAAAEVLKKTILGTQISYKDDDTTKAVPLTDSVETSDMSYGEDSSGKKVLRFTVTFPYSEEFFARNSKEAIILRPDRQNVTDSFLRLPESLFDERASDLEEDQ